jgi:RND family efflux transporter MFP subunit
MNQKRDRAMERAGKVSGARRSGVLELQTAALGLLVLLACVGEVAAEEIDLECLIEPKQRVVVSAPTIGVVGSVLVQRGDFVTRGQVLSKLESSVEETALAVARARAEATGELEGSKARLGFEQRRLQRAFKLHGQNVLADEELDEVESGVLIAETGVRQAEESALLARLDFERAKAALAVRTVRSPVDGVIVKVILHEGEYADPPQVLEVAQIDPLHVEVYVPATLLGRIHVGDVGRVVLNAPEARAIEAKVTVVDRVVDAASGTFGVRLELPNAELEVLAGLSCRVRF